MKSDAVFLEQIVTAPADDGVRLVYADSLEERGDVRAEYLRSEVTLAKNGDAAARKRFRAMRAKVDPAWLAVLEAPGVMRANPTPFPATWWSIDLPKHRPVDATYGSWPYASLPRLPYEDTRGFVAMKRALARESRRQPDGSPLLGDLTRVERSAKERASTLPPQVREFFSAGDLPAQLRSCTACWYNFGDLIECPGDEGALLVRFYSDQQSCLHWYLHLDPSGSHCVVSGVESFEDEDEDWDDDEEEEADPAVAAERAEQLLRAIGGGAPVPEPATPEGGSVSELCFAAPSFEAFLHRMWIENECWYALADKTPLSGELRAYLAHYGPAR